MTGTGPPDSGAVGTLSPTKSHDVLRNDRRRLVVERLRQRRGGGDVIEQGRDLEGVIRQYRSTAKPMHEPTDHADRIVFKGANVEAVALLTERLRAETDETARETRADDPVDTLPEPAGDGA